MSFSFGMYDLKKIVDTIYQQTRNVKGGKKADYIPSLANVPEHLSALVVATAKGEIFCAGDSYYEFAIESISKICTLALLMEQKGAKEVRQKIGAKPTGLPFNSVLALIEHQGKPLTPLVNAGAIASVSLLEATSKQQRWELILSMQSRLAGRRLNFSEQVNHSEQTTNGHNRAIAWLLDSSGNCFCDPMEACEVYTRQCSTLIHCKDLALMGATLANLGVHPLTGEKVINSCHIPPILAEMTMEGLYTYSGDWAFEVGLPAKSGVGGGLIAISPGNLAIAAFAPPIDEAGNSIKAQAMVSAVAKELGLSIFSA